MGDSPATAGPAAGQEKGSSSSKIPCKSDTTEFANPTGWRQIHSERVQGVPELPFRLQIAVSRRES